MARTKSTAVSVKPSNQQIAAIDQELNQEVADLRNRIGAPSGNAIKIKATGEFVMPDGSSLGDEIQVIVLEFTSKNFLYEGRYDPNNPTPPICFAVNKKADEMRPVDESPQKQNEDCASCRMNAFGTGENGRSKACKNTREIAVLFVDPDSPNAHNDPEAPIYTISLSPTMIKPFETIVSSIARMLGGPPIKSIVTMRAANVGTYAAVTFHDPIANPDYAQHVSRRGQANEMLARVPDFTPRTAQPQTRTNRPTPRRGAAPQQPAARGRR